MKIKAEKIGKEKYLLPDESIIERSNRTTNNGNNLNGRWAIIDSTGCLLDFDQYINDLADRNNIDLYS